MYTVSKKQAKLLLSELQISTNFDNFRQTMDKTIELREVHSFSTSPNLCQRTIPC